MPATPSLRVIVRLPCNRPDDAPVDPPRVEWNADKEHILWEVIAKSRAIEGAGTDWNGLAEHLQVPLPYLVYRTQVRYEEDLRSLQALGLRSPQSAFPSAPFPIRNGGTGEYFPRVNDLNPNPNPNQSQNQNPTHRDSGHTRLGSSTSAATPGMSSTSGTGPGMSTLRPVLGVRARLSSLGHAHGRTTAQLRSPIGPDHVRSPLAAQLLQQGPPYPRPSKKVSSSSTITLQGPRKTRSPPLLRPLSSASSRAGSCSSPGGANEAEDTSEEDEDEDADEEDARKEEEAERQEILARKLRDLEKLMTKDALGLVVDPATRANDGGSANKKSRGRTRPLSGTSASLSSSATGSRSQSHQSLSSASVDSPQGSIPSIPSPSVRSNPRIYQYPQASAYSHNRQHNQGYGYNAYATNTHEYHHPTRSQSQSQPQSQSQSLSSHSLSQSRSNSHSNPQSPPQVSSPRSVSRHLGGTPEKSSSPPALSPGSARGQTAHSRNLRQTQSNLVAGTPSGSEASSFSDLSDASLSQSALESALMSNIKGGGSRLSSFARSHLPGSRRSTRS